MHPVMNGTLYGAAALLASSRERGKIGFHRRIEVEVPEDDPGDRNRRNQRAGQLIPSTDPSEPGDEDHPEYDGERACPGPAVAQATGNHQQQHREREHAGKDLGQYRLSLQHAAIHPEREPSSRMTCDQEKVQSR